MFFSLAALGLPVIITTSSAPTTLPMLSIDTFITEDPVSFLPPFQPTLISQNSHSSTGSHSSMHLAGPSSCISTPTLTAIDPSLELTDSDLRRVSRCAVFELTCVWTII